MNSIKSTYQVMALAFLMLITSMGFTIDMHFCQGHLQSISFFGKAKTCHEMSKAARMKNCPHYKKMMEKNGKCPMNEKDNCENKTLCLQFDKDPKIQKLLIDISKQFKQFIRVFQVEFFLNSFSFENNLSSFVHYKPPLILRDIPVLVQSFLL